MKLPFTRRATKNLIDIADFIRAQNPAAAHAVRSAIIEASKHCCSSLGSVGGKRPKAFASS
jgi:plasmid stabilization system protein ParE